LDRTSRPRALAAYRLEELDGEQLLYSAEHTRILYCNETASLIWRLCDGDRTVDEITMLLQDAFPDAAVSISADVEATIDEYLQQGAVELV
jgi:hypothetical protein